MDHVDLRRMRSEEREAVLDLLEGAFGERDLFARYFDFDPELGREDCLLACTGDNPIACVQIFTKRIHLRGQTLKLGGIGSVATHAEWRHQGLASMLLQEAISEMRRRDMALSLLFAGPLSLYERQGWVSIPERYLRIHAPEHFPSLPEAYTLRNFESRDLSAVRDLYERYSARLETTTKRSADYWDGQLRYAGNPGEDFSVAERGGQIVAYARVMGPPDERTVLEYACEAGKEVEMCTLLLRLASPGRAMVSPAGPLDAILRKLGARLQLFRPQSAMWRVLDRAALERIGGAGSDDAQLLKALVDRPDALYWPADRF